MSEERTRDLRQRDIVPVDKLADVHATVIGVGAIGRQVALQLACIGVPYLTLYDDDVVSIENVAPQGYKESDINTGKTLVTMFDCEDLCRGMDVQEQNKRFGHGDPTTNVMFVCVDSMMSRGIIWETARNKAALYIDGRMGAELCQVYAAVTPPQRDTYSLSLFSDNQAYVGPCTAKSTIYCANIAAGLMVANLTKWLRDMVVPSFCEFNILSCEFEARYETPLKEN